MKRLIFRLFGATLIAAALGPRPIFADETLFSPALKNFSCVLPEGWSAFEDVEGSLVHLLGPQRQEGDYRAGIDIEFMQDGSPNFVPYEKEIAYLRNGDKGDKIDSSLVQALRISGTLGRYIETNESRILPDSRLPATETELHHFTAFVPVPNSGSYYVIDLSASEASYLNYRTLFMEFLKSFHES